MALPKEPLPASASPVSGLIDSIDPACGAVTARFKATHPAELPLIFKRARIVQTEWAAQPLRSRCSIVQRLRDVVFDSRHEIAGVITQETGKPRVEAILAEILFALDTADFFTHRAPRWLRSERVPHHNLALKAKSGWLAFEPYGIVAIISPWNYPFAIPLAQIIPALIGGNAVLLKPSELTPSTGALIAGLIRRAQFPSDLVQVLQGGADVGAALIDAAPDKVCFTGSVATGQRIAEACGRKLIPSVLELGGKDPMIVLADADLETASSAAVWGSFTNCGQACLSVERIYVERAAAERFTALCVQKTAKLRVGPPADPDAEIGPMIRLHQLEKVEEHLREAVARGATILTGGGGRPDLGVNFLEPTVITNVDHSMKIMREETFGPVLAIQVVASAEEALALANDSPFALSGSIWTADEGHGKQLASRLRAGSVMVNDLASYYGISEAPHGGRGASGWGRTHSRLGLLEMVHVKYVDVDRLPRLAKSWWYGYTEDLATAADRFVDLLFARRWRRRFSALISRKGALGVLFRSDRI
ncbi:MAG: aldehyde dehydrogenase family protein [Candidatus Acidiferrales bacterium]|jgi:succinate-semialdehyde dehydrogenase/glutarate-semialdehyde dehydrogenase